MNHTEARYRELLALVEADRARRCDEIRQRSALARRRIVQEARAEARRRAGASFAELRARAARELRLARAELDSARRRQRFAGERAILGRGMALLALTLRRRWQDAALRRAWADAVLAAAAQFLPAGPWRIECPPGLGEEERRRLGAQVDARDDIETGIRVRSALACVDGTMAGLLADRLAVEARLLAEAEAA
jgi:hypothetical protein